MSSAPESVVYHERQDSALCGQHCINNLLQGYYYSASDLADIAHVLHEREKDNLRQSSQGQLASRELVALLAQPNQHVDLSGNFSIEVLRTAVNNPPHRLQLVSMAASDPAIAGDITSHSGFIIHQSQHWYAVRKLHGHWWNLDSMLESPQHISEFYLAAFINQQLHDGNMVFVATGSGSSAKTSLPTASREPSELQHQASGLSSRHNLFSLLRLNHVPVPTNAGMGQQPNVSVFQGVGNRLGGTGGTSGAYSGADNFTGEDADLLRAIALSLKEQEATASAQTQGQTQLPDDDKPLTEKERMRQKRLAAMNR